MNYKEYGGGYEPGDSVSIYDDVVVESELAPQTQEIGEALIKVINSHNEATDDDTLLEEAFQLLEMSSDEYERRGRASLMTDLRRKLGAQKRKGIARITEAKPQAQSQFDFVEIPIGEGGVLVLNENMTIPIDYAKRDDIAASHLHYTAKNKAKIEELENQQRQRTSSVSYLKGKMAPDKALRDYDNGEGVAEI